MRIFGGILGILGGLLGLGAFLFNFVQGFTLRPVDDNVMLGVAGGVALCACIALSVAIFTGAGRLAGVGLLVMALIAFAIAMSYGGSYLVAFAVVGGVLAAASRPRHSQAERFDWESEQSFGSGR